MGRHAYLIICHNNFAILEKLISLLDYPLNDIYIHVDRKVQDISALKRRLMAKNATITYTKRVKVTWGGFSQVKAELILLKEAAKNEHDYYHLLSGVDMPLRSQEYIHNFFREHTGNEFIDFDPIAENESFEQRLRYYRFFQDVVGRRSDNSANMLRRLESLSINLQQKLGIDRRILNSRITRKGSQWFSITHHFALYLLQNEKEIKDIYRFGLGVDELLVQTFSLSSPFCENIYGSAMRYIDWNRGRPYTFRSEDYEELMASENLFARKFDEAVDMEIVNKIYESVSNRIY